MWRYYGGLFRDLPAEFRAAVETVGFWIGFAVTGLTFLWPRIEGLQEAVPIPSWVKFAAIGALILWLLLHINYRRFLASTRSADSALADLAHFMERAPRIDWVALSHAESQVGHFDLLVHVSLPEGTAIGDWTVEMAMSGGESRVFRGKIASHGMEHPSLCQLRVGFPYDHSASDRSAVLKAKLIRLRGVDVQGREVVYIPATPETLPEAWPDYIQDGELRAREHSQYLASVGSDSDATYLLKRLGDAAREEDELRTRGEPVDAVRVSELEDIQQVAASSLARISGGAFELTGTHLRLNLHKVK
jgi:hypothetical protein